MMSTRTASVRIGAALTLAGLMVWAQRQSDAEWSPRLILDVVDAQTGKPIAARFSLMVDGVEHEPRWLGAHGWRFVSVHVSKRQTSVVTYARGTGPVEIPLRPGARSVEIRAAKGFDYHPVKQAIAISKEATPARIEMRRWNQLHEQGWRAADPHLHYDRIRPEGDADWLDAMDGDGLSHASFLVLKGGMVPGVWANQFGYGARGETTRDGKTIVAGQEYRDSLQGHLLLYGLGAIIQPIMAGTAESPHHWPAALDVMQRSRQSGGIAGAAHGGTLSQSPTVIADAILGGLDFMELGNLFLWEPEKNWYPLLNCGYLLPPTAGSDLPNAPYRDWWQPFLGSIRTYVKTGGGNGWKVWSEALQRGEVFVSSGPVIHLSVNQAVPGGRIDLPVNGGEVEIQATLESPRPVRALELIHNGKAIASATPGEKRMEIRTRVRITSSSWLAVRGTGAPLPAMKQHEVAHSGVVQVQVGGRRIWSAEEGARLSQSLAQQKEFYRTNGRYGSEQDRQAMLAIFDRAIAELAARAAH